MPMTLQQLILSSAAIVSEYGKANHSMGRALAKQFGTIYYNNKTVIYDEASGIIEIRMVMGTDTETQYKGFHAVRLAVYGAVGKVYENLQELYYDKVVTMMDDPTVTTATDEHMKNLRKAYNNSTGKDTVSTKKRVLPDRDKDLVDVKFGEEVSSRLTGAIIPVANTSANTTGNTYGTNGKIFYLEQPIGLNNMVRVSCSCSDYFYRCAWYNFEAGAHLGAKPNSNPRRREGATTVQNVHRSPGLCKHLMMFAMLLINGGIISGLGDGSYEAYRQAILDRTEKLVVPKKLAEGEQLSRMYSTLTRNLKKATTTRNISAGYKANFVQGYQPFKRQVMRQNELARKQGAYSGSVTKGTSQAAYDVQAIERWAKEIHKRTGGYKI